MEDIKSDDLMVFFANQELDEKLTLSDYRINRLSNPLFVSMVKKRINISVKIDREKEYKIEVSPKNSIEEILNKLLTKQVIQSKQVIVTYRNQQLDKNKTLFGCKIRDGNFIFVNTKNLLNI